VAKDMAKWGAVVFTVIDINMKCTVPLNKIYA
jgi:hypothetical protein